MNGKTIILSMALAGAFAANGQGEVLNMDEQTKTTLESIRYIDLPATRFIGKTVIGTPKEYGEMWGRSGEFMPALDALIPGYSLAEFAVELAEPCGLMHFNNRKYDEPGNVMHYIVGKFFKAGTPVPDGLDYYDTPASKIALSIVRGEFMDMIGNAPGRSCDRIAADGYGVVYPDKFFQAEVYVKENIPKEGVVSKLGYVFSVYKQEAKTDGEKKEELFTELPKPATLDELRAYAATREDPAKQASKIAGIRRLWHDDKSENFYLEGCLAAAVKAAGGAPDYDYMFFLTVGGTLFTQHYGLGCDGLASLLGHRAMPHFFKQCGYSYLYIDRATIESQPALVVDAIKTAVDKGIPVLSWGIANLPLKKGIEERHECWCNIGGYDADGVLYVNAYPEGEATDEHGYFTIKDGLTASEGLYILREKIDAPSVRDAYRAAIYSIPAFVSLPPFRGATFGAQAYYDWADALSRDAGWDDGGFVWGHHNAPWVNECTRHYYFRTHFDRVARESGLPVAEKVKAVYAKIFQLDFQQLHGGDFFATPGVITTPDARRDIANVMRQKADLHNELLALFADENNTLNNEEKISW